MDKSIIETNQESYNMYDYGDNCGQVESQDMINTMHTNHATTETEDNCSVSQDITDSEVASGIYEMGRNCMEMEQEIMQKYSDIQLLQENAKSLRAEIEEKQKNLEMLKVELLTEEDNYDDVQKKINNEIELITDIGLHQNALNTQTKHLLEQKFKVDQLLENNNAEFSVAKIESEKIIQLYEEKHDKFKTKQETLIANMKREIEKNKLISEEHHNIEEQLKLKIYEMKHMIERQKVTYYQKLAVFNYLKVRENEELSKCTELESELKHIQENGNKQIILEEKAYSCLEEREKEINNKLLELKLKIESDNFKLQQLEQHKNCLQDEVENLEREETAHLQKCENISELLSIKNTEIEKLRQTFNSKKCSKQENSKLKHLLEVLEQKKRDILLKNSETSNKKTEASKRCKELSLALEHAYHEQTIIKEVKNNFDSKKSVLIEQFEGLKEQTKNREDELENQKSTSNSQLEALEIKINKGNNEIESLLKTADDKARDVLNMKQQLEDNCSKVTLLHNELDRFNRYMTEKQVQFDVDMVVCNKTIYEKEIIKMEAEAEIDRRLKLQSETEYLKGELQVLDCQMRDELKALKDKCQLELQPKQEEVNNEKNSLEAKYKEKKKIVSDLQEEIVDEQKNELQLVKAIQKSMFISDAKKRELVTLKNVTKTLDEKLRNIAQAVTNSLKDKESTTYSQSTVLSGSMCPPKTVKEQKKATAPGDDSSSSGVSIHDDTTWVKEIRRKQQKKQNAFMKQQMEENTQILTPNSMRSQVPQGGKLSATTTATDGMKFGETPKVIATELKNVSTGTVPKRKTTGTKKSQTPAKKIKD